MKWESGLVRGRIDYFCFWENEWFHTTDVFVLFAYVSDMWSKREIPGEKHWMINRTSENRSVRSVNYVLYWILEGGGGYIESIGVFFLPCIPIHGQKAVAVRPGQVWSNLLKPLNYLFIDLISARGISRRMHDLAQKYPAIGSIMSKVSGWWGERVCARSAGLGKGGVEPTKRPRGEKIVKKLWEMRYLYFFIKWAIRMNWYLKNYVLTGDLWSTWNRVSRRPDIGWMFMFGDHFLFSFE